MKKKVLLHLDGLDIWYDKHHNIIENAQFSLMHHEVLALVGVNGAGKSTLLNTLCGIHERYRLGQSLFLGRAMTFADEAFKLQRMAVFAQDESFRYWSFNEYLPFIFAAYNRSCDQSVLDYLIDGFNFRSSLEIMKKDLSLGNKKKFALIAAFALRLPLLILDEPTDSLDFSSTAFLYSLIRAYKSYGSIIMATHIAESIGETSDAMILLRGGKIYERVGIKGSTSVLDIVKMVEGMIHA